MSYEKDYLGSDHVHALCAHMYTHNSKAKVIHQTHLRVLTA